MGMELDARSLARANEKAHPTDDTYIGVFGCHT